jgi:pyridoxine kinase
LATSLHLEDTPKEAVDLLASGPDGRFRLRTPRLDVSANGAGDAIAALFFFHLLRNGSTAEALSRAASSIFGVLEKTQQAGARELLLVAAQDEIVRPTRVFRAEAVG